MVEAYIIYGLVDPRNGQLRYVGKCATSLRKRMREHLCEARTGKRRHVYNWIRQLLAADTVPEVEVLEAHENADALVEAERHFIAYFRGIGCRLTNATDGGEGVSNPSLDVRAKLSAASLGRKHTSEARAKISAAGIGRVPYNKGQRMSDAQRQKMLGRTGPKGIAVVDETGVVYRNSAAAERALGLPAHTVNRAARRGYSVRGHNFKVVLDAALV